MKPALPEPLMDVLVLLADGADTAQVAEKLHLSVEAVKSRIQAMLRALGADSRAHAVAMAYRAGVLDNRRVDLPDLLVADVPVKALVDARLRAGLTQAALAAQLAHSQTWLQHRETGKYLFTVRDARRYARIVGVDLDAS